MTLTAMDYEAIRRLQARYAFAIDLGDRAAFEACFAPDGTFVETGLPEGLPGELRLEGRPALGEFAERFHRTGQGQLRHWSSPPLIESHGDEATGLSFLMVLRPGSAPGAGVLLTGLYRDRYRQIDGRWHFAERVFSADPQPEHRQSRPTDPLVGRFDAFAAGARSAEPVPAAPPHPYDDKE